MLIEIIPRTQTGAMIAAKDPAGFRDRVSAAVDRAVEKHGAKWAANLAAAYGESLNPAELRSACDAINHRDSAAFAPLGARAGKAMKARSSELLNKIGGEVLADLWSQVT